MSKGLRKTERRFVRENYGVLNEYQIAEQLGKPLKSVRISIGKMRLDKPSQHDVVFRQVDVQRCVDCGASVVEVDKYGGCRACAVRDRRISEEVIGDIMDHSDDPTPEEISRRCSYILKNR